MGYTQKIVIVGAGISGLACAYRLQQLGLYPLVLEAADRPGGVIMTLRRNGFLFETGPQFPRFPPSVWRLVQELHLENEFVAGDPQAKRYILYEGHLHAAPFSPAGLVSTRLLGLTSKLRVLAEPFGYSQPPRHEETLADFVVRKFGTEMLENLVDPLISTIFFGDAHKMGMESAFPALVEWERSRGSLVRGAFRARRSKRNSLAAAEPSAHSVSRESTSPSSLQVTDALPTLGSFKSGMGTLPEKLAAALGTGITYRLPVVSVLPLTSERGESSGGWQIRLPGVESIRAEQLVLAVPAHVAAHLLETSVPQLARHLQEIAYAPICVVCAAYDRRKVAHNLAGLGFMAPRREGLNTICTFWNSSLFAGRAPQGAVVLTSFAGRGMRRGLDVVSDEECAKTVEAENARVLGISGQPLDRVVWRDPGALPQYNVGHARRVAEISSMVRTLPGLHLAGNFLHGRSLGECVDVACRVADDLHSQLRHQNI